MAHLCAQRCIVELYRHNQLSLGSPFTNCPVPRVCHSLPTQLFASYALALLLCSTTLPLKAHLSPDSKVTPLITVSSCPTVQTALAAGAEIVVQSSHKTLSALTQAAMLHVRSPAMDRDRISRALQMLQVEPSSSAAAHDSSNSSDVPAYWLELLGCKPASLT